MLDELETVHSSTELEIMDMYHNIEKAVEQIEDGCKFTERVLKNGNMVEVLLMKKNIRQQLLMLLNNIPRPDVNVKIEFVTDSDRFRRSIKEVFGHFKKSEEYQEKVGLCPEWQKLSLSVDIHWLFQLLEVFYVLLWR